jgi:hypothetical protein
MPVGPPPPETFLDFVRRALQGAKRPAPRKPPPPAKQRPGPGQKGAPAWVILAGLYLLTRRSK